MKTFYSINTTVTSPSVVALGCFDGVHTGHMQVINKAREIADSQGLPLVVWSFAEPPRNFFFPNSIPLLSTLREKRKIMRELGVDIFFCIPFDKSIADMTAETFFFDLLLEKLCAKHIVCGFNFSFGARGVGNTSLLDKLCTDNNIGLTVLPPVVSGDTTVSSSEIRKAIECGEVRLAERLLGRPYSITARVVNGQHLARSLGFPTANQLYPKNKAVLRYGVYEVSVKRNEQIYKGISNVGVRPTVNGSLLCIETHILDFNENLYGKELTIEFLDFIRPEQRFSSIDELAKQIKNDLLFLSKK